MQECAQGKRYSAQDDMFTMRSSSTISLEFLYMYVLLLL